MVVTLGAPRDSFKDEGPMGFNFQRWMVLPIVPKNTSFLVTTSDDFRRCLIKPLPRVVTWPIIHCNTPWVIRSQRSTH
jgi:hypothetical protein